MNEPWNLEKITYKVVKENQYNTAVLPIGSIEPHNFHLPYGTDAINVKYVAEKMCERAYANGAKVLLLPAIPYGVNGNMGEFPFAMNINQTTLNQIITDLIETLEKNGIEKLLVLNGHGGNKFDAWQRSMLNKTKVFIVVMDWWAPAAEEEKDIFEKGGFHANEMETSVDLVTVPELVHLEDADEGVAHKTRFDAINKGWATITPRWHLFTENSGWGNPKKGTREKGEKYLEIVIDRGSDFIKKLSDSQIDEKFPY